MKAIFAVMNTSQDVVKIRPEKKIQACIKLFETSKAHGDCNIVLVRFSLSH